MNKALKERDVICFLAELRQEEKSEATREKYERDIRRFLRFMGDMPVSKERVMEYKQDLIRRYAPASVNSMIIPVNRFLRSAGMHECAVKTLKIQRASFRSPERELSREEYVRLVKAAERMGDRRISLILQTIASTGIRIGELPFITVEALRSGVANVFLKGKQRNVLIPKELKKKLRAYVKEKKIVSGSIFVTRSGKPVHRCNVLKSMKRLCETAHVRPNKVFPHNFRHLFACLYYQTTGDIVRLADILGHSSINTTRIYTAVSMEKQAKQINLLRLVI